MLSYSGDSRLKSQLLEIVQYHQDADHIVQGIYAEGDGEDWRGCSVGCSIQALNRIKGTDFPHSDHSALETGGLWPEWLSMVEDVIFDGRSAGECGIYARVRSEMSAVVF